MEPATAMPELPFKKKPRSGQTRAFEALATHREKLNIKFPTAYGKTYTAAGIYSILQHQGRVTRCLMIVPSTGQLTQFYNDARHDFVNACVDGPLKIIDIGFSGAVAALKAHRNNEAQFYVITVQALRESRGMNAVKDLLGSGLWMIVVDEYHHYGIDKTWGRTVLGLSRSFLLAMSATPWRPGDDSAFGPPDIEMTYQEAREEKSVKPLRGHSYNFRIHVINGDEQELSYTSKEFTDLAGGSDPDKIEKLVIERRMRWSPSFISPLVTIPIERMLRERVVTGFRLQALVGAMSVSHAEFVYEQLRGFFPELRIDWVGTGTDGRTKEQNDAVLAAFCPPKQADGRRPDPAIDVLVHVGMAGEGLDSINVSEIVFLSRASICNSKIQEIGRAARFLDGVVANVNFDASSEFAIEHFVGEEIEKAMDYEAANPDAKEPEEDRDPADLPEMPDEPTIQIFNLELIEIDSGGVRQMAYVAAKKYPERFDLHTILSDPAHPDWQDITSLYRGMRTKEAVEFNEKAEIKQWDEAVEVIVRHITRRVIETRVGRVPFDPKMAGDIKRKINARKKGLFGEKRNDIAILKHHYTWCRQLERDIIASGLPPWLS